MTARPKRLAFATLSEFGLPIGLCRVRVQNPELRTLQGGV